MGIKSPFQHRKSCCSHFAPKAHRFCSVTIKWMNILLIRPVSTYNNQELICWLNLQIILRQSLVIHSPQEPRASRSGQWAHWNWHWNGEERQGPRFWVCGFSEDTRCQRKVLSSGEMRSLEAERRMIQKEGQAWEGQVMCWEPLQQSEQRKRKTR